MTQDIWKRKLLTTTLIATAASAMWAGAAFAQDNDAEDEDSDVIVIEEVEAEDEARQERVVVTGSRLARDEYTSVSPLQVIDGDTARDLGLVDASDLLSQTTVVQGQQVTTGVSTSAGLITDSGPGSATASLRGLDAGRTLVLVNGRRLAPAGVRGVPSAPDLNLIPGSLVERVDVLLDGASSVYGSDAVAGVVNYILRTDFDGLQFDAFYTDPEMSGNAGKQQVYSATMGVSSDRGFMTFAAEYSQSDAVTEKQFGSFYHPYDGNCLSFLMEGASGRRYEYCSGSFGAGAISGTPFGFLKYEPGFNFGAPLPPNFKPVSTRGLLIEPDNLQGQDLLIYPEELKATLLPNFERTTLYSTGEYETDLYGDLTAYFEASWSNRITDNSTAGQGAIPLDPNYALNVLGTAGTLYYNTNFFAQTEVAQTRLIGGIKGDLPFMDSFGTLKNWGYDAYLSYSRSNGDDTIQGIPYFPRLEQTLENTRFDPATGQFVCDPRTIPNVAQQVTCRPLPFFTEEFIFTGRFPDDADTEYLFPNRITNTVVEQSVFNAYISGDLFELPAGPVGMVLGVELRDDAISTKTDAGASAGDFQGFLGDPGSNGSRMLQEGFIELELPLVADKPFVEELTLNGAARWTEEDNFGAQWTYRVQGQYAPVDWFRLRSTYGTSYRAPNLGEQFGGRVTGFGNPGDPCRVPGVAVPFDDYDNDPNTPDTREYVPALDPRDPDIIQNCLNGGGPYNIPGTDPFSLGVRGLGTSNPVFFGAPTRVASGSNPDLEAETSEALSVGLVFEQPWTDRFDLRTSVTYYEIKVQDEVDQLTAAVITSLCYDSPGLTDARCQFLTRAPRVPGDDTSGEITFVSALQQNLGEQISEGIDYNLEFGIDFNAPYMEGEVRYDLIARATQSLTQTEEIFEAAGVRIDDDLTEYGNPEWRLNLTNVFSWNDWRFLWQSRWIDEMVEDVRPDERNEEIQSNFYTCFNAALANDRPCLQVDGLENYWVHDISLAWEGDTMIVRGGVSNIFNNAPPNTDNPELSNIGGIGYDLGGRTLFLNITKSF